MSELNPGQAVPEPDADFERRLWERLGPQVQRAMEQKKRRRRVVLVAGSCAGMALLAVLLPLAEMEKRSAAPSLTVGVRTENPVASRGSGVVQAKWSDHLERSQILLTEMAHVKEGDAKSEQELARNLLDDNRLLKEASLRGKEYGRVAVLDALEPTLLTIANGPGRMTKADVDSLQERLQENSLLFKVRVARNQLGVSDSRREIRKPL